MADVLGSLLGGLGGSSIGQAIVQLRLDTDSYTKEMAAAKGETTAATSSMGSTFSKFGGLAKAGLVAAGAAVAAFAAHAVQAASDQGEALNKVQVIFGKNGDAVEKWSGQLAEDFGLSKTAALDAAGGFGAMLQSAGVTGTALKTMSTKVVELAGDLASFNNVDPTEALEKLRSGLAGEAEPLRKFGVFLSEAAVQQEAVNSGIAKQGEVLTEAQKVQARYQIILQQTTTAHGDFARTSDSIPNTMRTISAEFENVSAEIGKALLPLMQDLLGVVKNLVPLIGILGRHLDTVVTVLLGFVALKFIPGLLAQIEKGFIAMQVAMGASLTAQGALSRVFQTLIGASPGIIVGITGIAVAIEQMGHNAAETEQKVADLTQRLIDGKIGVDAYHDSVVAAEVGTGAFAGRLPKVTQEANEVADAGVRAAETMTRVAMSESFASAQAEQLAHTHEVAGKTVKNFANMTEEEIKEWKTNFKESIRTGILVLEDFTTETGITREDFLKATRVMAREAREFSQSMREISHEHWIPDEYITFLSEQGPEWINAFADLTEKQQRRAVDWWTKGKDAIGKANEAIDRTVDSTDRFGGKTTRHTIEIHYKYVDFDPTKPGMQTGTKGQR